MIVVDGGSTDGTVEYLECLDDARLVQSDKGRAKQLNAGQQLAKAPYLLFLHADSVLTNNSQLAGALLALQQAETNAGDNAYIAGHFPLCFHDYEGSGSRYRYLAAKTYLNRQNTTNGDQGMMCSQRVFSMLGGFDETWGFLEDQTFAETLRMHPQGGWVTLPAELSTSARRFEVEGFAKRYMLMSMMMAMYMIGFHQFFHQAPHVYREQSQSNGLLLTPFYRLITQLMKEQSWLSRLTIWCRVGGYIASNGWQAWLLPQILFGREQQKARESLAWYDRWLAPIVNFPLWWPVVGLVAWFWSFIVLRLWYRISERKFLR